MINRTDVANQIKQHI